MHQRMKAEDLRINMEEYKKRKQQTIERIAAMMRYVRETRKCRSQYIAAYFGDTTSQPCGICDNCLNNKQSNNLTAEEFKQIHQRIIEIAALAPVSINQLLQQLSTIRKEKAWQVIHFLQAENKISVDEKGWISIER